MKTEGHRKSENVEDRREDDLRGDIVSALKAKIAFSKKAYEVLERHDKDGNLIEEHPKEVAERNLRKKTGLTIGDDRKKQ